MNQSSWYEALVQYCLDFNIPIENLAEIMRDPKVNPMIRGKGFEYSTLQIFKKVLDPQIWEVSKPSMNAQAMDHDVDILVRHIPTNKNISVECKLSKKGSFKISRSGEITSAVKCMRSRTLGIEVIKDRAPLMGVTVSQLNGHKDNYLTTDFDVVVSSLGNAFYTTDEDTSDYVWTPSEDHLEAIKNILKNPDGDLKKSAFEYILIAKASDLAPKAGFYECTRRTCTKKTTCVFIPNYPVVEFDSKSGLPKLPWNPLTNLNSVLLEVLSKK
jgi:hypothetical protein